MPLENMEDLKGKKIVTWGKSNKDDRREVSPPPGFPPCTKPRSCDREVSPPPGFPRCAKTDQNTDKGKEKEVRKAPESKAIPHSATREKSSKCKDYYCHYLHACLKFISLLC